MGVDFGTSCSKVVIRTPYLRGTLPQAVPFLLQQEEATYLVPTAIQFCSDGVGTLVPPSRTSEAECDLKVALMDRPEDPDVAAHAAAYIALLIRHARAWFRQSQRSIVSQYDLRWSINLGIPSAGYDDTCVRASFRRVLGAAYRLAVSDGAIRLTEARQALELEPSVEALDVVPEIAAAVVGYSESSLRSRDLHVLVDIGAATVDVCAFNLPEDHDRYVLLTALVKRLGVHELHRSRLRAIPHEAVHERVAVLDLSDPLTTIPEAVADYSRNGAGETVRTVDRAFSKRCAKQLMACLIHVRKKRYPNSPAWESGVPVFLAGGGAHMDFYNRVCRDVSERCERAFRSAPLRIRPLFVPKELGNRDIGDDLFLRLAVAYGLSIESINIGEIVAPHQVEDVPPASLKAPVPFVSKDQV